MSLASLLFTLPGYTSSSTTSGQFYSSTLTALTYYTSAPQIVTITITRSSSPDSTSGNPGPLLTASPTTFSSASPSNMSSSIDSGDGSNASNNGSSDGNRTTIIVLATLMSIVGACLIAGAILGLLRCRQRRTRLFSRGITPIDDDEIETWKGNRAEKGLGEGVDLTATTARSEDNKIRSGGHQKNDSVSSTKKPPSLIVYSRISEDRVQPRSPPMSGALPGRKMSLDGSVAGGKMSIDKDLPFTPIQARAPNAREGLTDEAIPGDPSFIPSPRRQHSRLSKAAHHPRFPRPAHMRNRSSRSINSLDNYTAGIDGFNSRNIGYESDADITPYRASHDHLRYHSHPVRDPSSSAIPPRLSFSEDWPSPPGGLSPRPSAVRKEDIGRAIG